MKVAQLLPPVDQPVRLVRSLEAGADVEDAVLGEAVDPALLVAVVDALGVPVQGSQDLALGLEEVEPRPECVEVGHGRHHPGQQEVVQAGTVDSDVLPSSRGAG